MQSWRQKSVASPSAALPFSSVPSDVPYTTFSPEGLPAFSLLSYQWENKIIPKAYTCLRHSIKIMSASWLIILVGSMTAILSKLKGLFPSGYKCCQHRILSSHSSPPEIDFGWRQSMIHEHNPTILMALSPQLRTTWRATPASELPVKLAGSLWRLHHSPISPPTQYFFSFSQKCWFQKYFLERFLYINLSLSHQALALD